DVIGLAHRLDPAAIVEPLLKLLDIHVTPHSAYASSGRVFISTGLILDRSRGERHFFNSRCSLNRY
ncbi:MAG: hypothetical protein ACREXP_19715, partial [Steroidobacteraceae bacterium]